jgi:hypothetical protein
LSGYVARAHDRVLGEAVRDAGGGVSRIVVLVGSSSTGKTRACWEAVQPLAQGGWRLWHPFDPTRADAALHDLEQVAPHTVVWFNEAQHYLGDSRVGERIAGAVRSLLTAPERGPVLVLGTLWPEYADRYTALPAAHLPDPHSQVRELLSGDLVSVPDSFDGQALRAAEDLARGGDGLLAESLARAGAHGRLAQDLAGAPELLRRYEAGSPGARALLEAAMDARRLGVGLDLSEAFLVGAAADYLSDHDFAELAENWADGAFVELARPVHGRQAPLRRHRLRPDRRTPGLVSSATAVPAEGPALRLADYLEQHGRRVRRMLCLPASFWHAADRGLVRSDDLDRLTEAAAARHRLLWAHQLHHRAAQLGSPLALMSFVRAREWAGKWDEAALLLDRAAQSGDLNALVQLGLARERAGDRSGAEAAALLAAERGSTSGLVVLAGMRERAEDVVGACELLRHAAAYGDVSALLQLAQIREEAGDVEDACGLLQQAVEQGVDHAVFLLAQVRERAGDARGAEAVVLRAAQDGDMEPLHQLAFARQAVEGPAPAEALVLQAVKRGHAGAVALLELLREQTRASHEAVLQRESRERDDAGQRNDGAAQQEQPADASDADGPSGVANPPARRSPVDVVRERAAGGDWAGAEETALCAAEDGSVGPLTILAQLRERSGDPRAADLLFKRVVDQGPDSIPPVICKRWPYGLDPDGTPSQPWKPWH